VSLAIINIGDSHRGDLAGAPLPGDALVAEDGAIAWIGDSADVGGRDHQVVVDAARATVVPGLIDSHVHTTFGDWTPRQGMIGFLESYLQRRHHQGDLRERGSRARKAGGCRGREGAGARGAPLLRRFPARGG
jgi:cytosine/adenosine deaminase-related metal-dependent hydrolase